MNIRNTIVAFSLVISLLLFSNSLQASVEVAGGTITPISKPGVNYNNNNNHPFPFMVFLPSGYSPLNTAYPLVFCLHGNGEVGNGSSDGTLIPSSSNQIAYLFGSGPLPLIKNGSTYFGDNGVIVVQPQSSASGDAAFNPIRVDLTMRLLLNTYNIDRTRIYTMGLSAGGGGIVRYAYSYANNPNYQLAVIVPFANIAGLGTTYTDFSKFTGSITWFINCSDDTIAPPILVSGRIWSGYGEGFAGGISRYIDQSINGGAVPASSIKNRSLNTHPDLATITSEGFNTKGTIPASQLSNTYTGSYNTSNGWSWIADQKFSAGSNLQFTIRKGGGHSGWGQTMGTGNTPNQKFWNWLLAQRLGQTPTSTDAPITIKGAISVRPIDTTVPIPPYGYLEYLPNGYNSNDTSTVWPLVIYLSDTSESGDGTDNSSNGHQLTHQIEKYGPFYQMITKQWDFPAIIIAPQVTTNWTKTSNIKNVVDYAKKNYHVDINRIYMTGKLEGANGIIRYSASYPNDLAAILIIETSIIPNTTQATTLRNLPIWMVHSFSDPKVSRSISIGWSDALATSSTSVNSNVMASYPGYGGDINHFAVDIDHTNNKPLNPNGEITSILGSSINGNIISFPSTTLIGSNVFSMWGGSDSLPFALVTVNGSNYVATRGYPKSLTLTNSASNTNITLNVNIQTPIGYVATAHHDNTGVWSWTRDQVLGQLYLDQQLLTLHWSQNPINAWTQSWGDANTWNWMFNQIKPINSNG